MTSRIRRNLGVFSYHPTGRVVATTRKEVEQPKPKDRKPALRQVTRFKPEPLRKKEERINFDLQALAAGPQPAIPLPLPPAIPPLPDRVKAKCHQFAKGGGNQRTHPSYWLCEVGRKVEMYTVDQGWRTGVIFGETEVEPGAGKGSGKGGKRIGAGRFVRIRMFGIHGWEDVKAELCRLLDMLLHSNEAQRTLYVHYKAEDNSVEPILTSTGDDQDPGTPDVHVQCSLCKKFRIVPPPWCYYAHEPDFVFVCSMKTSGCDAPWDEAELMYYEEGGEGE